jgi:catechol-2,3-dioxygenase
VNHLAFTATSREMLDAARVRWTDAGHEVVELDHEFCVSIYTVDPNGILVEWCLDSRPLDERDAQRAQHLLWAEDPEHESPVGFKVHPPTVPVG